MAIPKFFILQHMRWEQKMQCGWGKVVKGSVRLLSPPHIPFFPSKPPVFLFAASDFLDGAAVTGTLGVVCVVGGFLFKSDEARTIVERVSPRLVTRRGLTINPSIVKR